MFIQTPEYEIPTAVEVADCDFTMEGEYDLPEIVIPADPFLNPATEEAPF